jgi:hypothetical protein
LQERLKRAALRENLSVSATCAAFLRKALQEDTDLQYSATLEPVIDRSIARNMRGIATRMSWLLVRVAYDCGQTRGIVTNILGRQPGMNQDILKSILADSDKSTRAKIIRKTPQITELVHTVEKWITQGEQENKEGDKDNKKK